MYAAPGPGLQILTDLPRLRRDPLGTMVDYHRKYGDIVRLGHGSISVHLLGHPAHADHVLRRAHAKYDRQTRSANAVRDVTGESLLTNDGDAWRGHRLLMQPFFKEESLGALKSTVLDATNAMIDRWLQTNEIDIAAEMTRLTSTIVARAFFGADLDDDVARLMPLVLEETYERSTAIFPFGASRELLSARDELRVAVERILSRGDSPLLEHLRELSPQELRNETLALLLAGQETTANALAWTFALIGDGPHDPKAAVQEAMRLYPPIWIVERRAMEPDEIAGFEIPSDSVVYISPYVLHRHRDFWRDPERFDPSRFPEAERSEAYLPFGAGPHRCIGAAFAMIEAPLVIATVRERCIVEIDATPEPQAWITLRPREGMPARVRAR